MLLLISTRSSQDLCFYTTAFVPIEQWLTALAYPLLIAMNLPIK